MGKGDISSKGMANVTTGIEHRRKVSTVWDFPPGCGRGATTDHGLYRQITVDQGSDDYESLVLFVI
ncbi:hypothetical protein J1N35_013305, partial [Gossypium stocksii]